MELIRGIHNLHPEHHGCVLTLGNFDGVHLGHRAVIAGLQAQARALRLPNCVMIFEPQPLEFFNPACAPARLMNLRDKLACLDGLGVDRLFVVPFNRRLARYEAHNFVRDVLVDSLGVRHLVVGDDFRFGHQRQGDFALLTELGRQFGYSVESTQTYQHDNRRISSTRIREVLLAGELQTANTLLGYTYYIEGRVIHGDKRGRTIGYPTANIHLRRQHIPTRGVFAVDCITASGERYQGMANLGTRPTIDSCERMSLEAHLFDFSGDLYNTRLRVAFKKCLRPELRFDSLETLRCAILEDEKKCAGVFLYI